MKNEFTVTITSCFNCPYKWLAPNERLFCMYTEKLMDTGYSIYGHSEELPPIPDWCPALTAKTHRPAKEIAFDIISNDYTYREKLLDYPEYAANNVKYWLEAEATPELKKEVMRFVVESKRIRGRR